MKNYTPNLNPPLILAVQGGKGEGKSFQCREVCSQMGVYVVPVSGALLSGSHEKEAVEVFQRAYIFASLARTDVKRMTILLIDDFDLSVASTFDERRYTVNSQLLNGFLMNLTDDPTKCGDESTFRIPLIVTGNNFTALHAPLARHGRMNFYKWKPTSEQKRRIVSAIFDTVMSPRELHKIDGLVNAYPDEPISFFSALKEDIVDDAILQIIEQEQGVNLQSIQRVASKALRNQTIETLERLAAKRHTAVAENSFQSDNSKDKEH